MTGWTETSVVILDFDRMEYACCGKGRLWVELVISEMLACLLARLLARLLASRRGEAERELPRILSYYKPIPELQWRQTMKELVGLYHSSV